uniref:PX domain-containing protein n=1 Tax=Alexandrium monilatum TaxID=311494 RepID=A0A7S4V4P3_9DINO
MDSAVWEAARTEVGEEAGEAGDRAPQDAASAPGREKARADLLKVTAPMRRRFLGSLRDMIKGSVLADPDMWPSIRSGANAALDRMLLDIEHEIERNLHFSLLQQQADADALGPAGGVFTGIWWRFRAFVLHHYLPHNRYIFGKLKDPVYLFLYMATMIPVHGVRVAVFSVILLMILFPGPPDEYQLINYILLFKGMQFLTSGLIAMAMGAMKYFACYSWHKDALLACVDAGGPGANDSIGQLIDYLGSITLVWIAFSVLPRSKRHAPEAPIVSGKVSASDEEGAGGRLRHLLHYDVKCFVLSLLLLAVLTTVTCFDHLKSGSLGSLVAAPQFCANVFWCCNLYSILSLPFASFSIPGWQTVLTHSDPTGFNKHGACVPFGLSSVETKDEAAQEEEDGFTRVASIATSVLSVMERGREARGSQNQGEYQLGDLARGAWHSLWGSTDAVAHGGVQEGGPETSEGVASSISGLVQSIAATGREARDGEADGAYSFSDFSRGLWWTLRSSQTHQLSPPADASAEHPPSAEWPLAVASVRLSAEGTEHFDGVTYFSVEVFAEGSLDAEGGAEPWRVLRRYRDFYDLASRLGPRSTRYVDTPFPPKYVSACTDEMLEERRQALEAWLRSVLQDPLSQGSWARALHGFLEAAPDRPRESGGWLPVDGSGFGDVEVPADARAAVDSDSLAPWRSVDAADLAEADPYLGQSSWKLLDEHSQGSSWGSASATHSWRERSSGIPTQDLESAAISAAASSSNLQCTPRADEEDDHTNAAPELGLGEVLEGLTEVGRKALAGDVELRQPFRRLRTGLWTMLQNSLATDEDEVGWEYPEGAPSGLREPLLGAALPDPSATTPAEVPPELLEAGQRDGALATPAITRRGPETKAPPPDSPDAAGGTGSAPAAARVGDISVQARLGWLGRGIWSRLAAMQAPSDEPADSAAGPPTAAAEDRMPQLGTGSARPAAEASSHQPGGSAAGPPAASTAGDERPELGAVGSLAVECHAQEEAGSLAMQASGRQSGGPAASPPAAAAAEGGRPELGAGGGQAPEDGAREEAPSGQLAAPTTALPAAATAGGGQLALSGQAAEEPCAQPTVPATSPPMATAAEEEGPPQFGAEGAQLPLCRAVAQPAGSSCHRARRAP